MATDFESKGVLLPNDVAALMDSSSESEDEQQEEMPTKDPMFKMESCTLHVRGIPADMNCDQDWCAFRPILGLFSGG